MTTLGNPAADEPHYRLAILSAVLGVEERWIWTLRRDEEVAATGESDGVEAACRAGAFVAAADAAFLRVARRRF